MLTSLWHLTGLTTHLEEVIGDDGEAARVVSVIPDIWVVGKNISKHIKEEVQRILVQEVDLVQCIQGKVDVGASL